MITGWTAGFQPTGTQNDYWVDRGVPADRITNTQTNSNFCVVSIRHTSEFSILKAMLLPALCPAYPIGVLSFFLMGSVTSCALGKSLRRSASFAVLPNPVMYRRSGSGSTGKNKQQSSSHVSFFFNSCIVQMGFLTWEIQVAFPGEASCDSASWVFECFHNPLNSDMHYKIFNMCIDVNACNRTQGVYEHCKRV